MKILVLNYEFPPLGGGASIVTKELAENLAKKGNEIDIITMHYKGLKKNENINNINIYRVTSIRIKREKSNFFEMLSYLMPAYLKASELIKKSIIEKKPYDIMHCHFIIPTGVIAYLLKRKFKFNYIITAHGSDVPGYNPDRFNFLHFLLKPFWKMILRNSEKIITPSKRLKSLILEKYPGFNNEKIKIIPNGINLINKKINLKKKEKIILYAGRLFKRKGVQYLIKSSEVIPDDWKIYICGEGPERKELEKLASQSKHSNNINFLGWLDKKKLFEIYEKSSVFVLPSLEESFGLVLTEAMMFGNAIITTKGTGTEEVIENSGILINKDSLIKENLFELENALKKLTENKKELITYQKKSLIRVKLFNWVNLSKEYINEYTHSIPKK